MSLPVSLAPEFRVWVAASAESAGCVVSSGCSPWRQLSESRAIDTPAVLLRGEPAVKTCRSVDSPPLVCIAIACGFNRELRISDLPELAEALLFQAMVNVFVFWNWLLLRCSRIWKFLKISLLFSACAKMELRVPVKAQARVQ